MDTKTALHQLKTRQDTTHIILNHFQEKLDQIEPNVTDTKYIRLLTKVSELESTLADLKFKIKLLKKKSREEFIIGLKSRVKLISIDFDVTLWVDAKNISTLMGKQVGEIINLYNTDYRIAAVY